MPASRGERAAATADRPSRTATRTASPSSRPGTVRSWPPARSTTSAGVGVGVTTGLIAPSAAAGPAGVAETEGERACWGVRAPPPERGTPPGSRPDSAGDVGCSVLGAAVGVATGATVGTGVELAPGEVVPPLWLLLFVGVVVQPPWR